MAWIPCSGCPACRRTRCSTRSTNTRIGSSTSARGMSRARRTWPSAMRNPPGRVGVYTVVPGPGFLNTTAALCSAYAANAPVLCITGQIPSQHIGSGAGSLHELPDQLATIRLLTKWAARIDTPEQVPAVMDEAFVQMTTGRQRPVALEIPWDVLLAEGRRGRSVAPKQAAPADARLVDSRGVDEAVALIRSAQRPMIMVGSGAMEAGAQVLELAQRIQAPVVSFRSGRGVVSDDSPYCAHVRGRLSLVGQDRPAHRHRLAAGAAVLPLADAAAESEARSHRHRSVGARAAEAECGHSRRRARRARRAQCCA